MYMYINLCVLRPSKIPSFHWKRIKMNKININLTLSPASRSPPQKRKPSLACILCFHGSIAICKSFIQTNLDQMGNRSVVMSQTANIKTRKLSLCEGSCTYVDKYMLYTCLHILWRTCTRFLLICQLNRIQAHVHTTCHTQYTQT